MHFAPRTVCPFHSSYLPLMNCHFFSFWFLPFAHRRNNKLRYELKFEEYRVEGRSRIQENRISHYRELQAYEYVYLRKNQCVVCLEDTSFQIVINIISY